MRKLAEIVLMFKTLDPTLKTAWIARLRDPSSKKAHGQLANVYGGYCCLGHYLCIRFPDSAWKVSTCEPAALCLSENWDDAFLLSDRVKCELKLNNNEEKTLMDLNDGSQAYRAHSLAEIADILETGKLLPDSFATEP